MELSFGNDARSKIKSGLDKLANSVKCTLGPRGRHAAIERKFGPPLDRDWETQFHKKPHLCLIF